MDIDMSLSQQSLQSKKKRTPRSDKKKRYKQFERRESILSKILKTKDLESLYYFFLAGFILFIVSTIIDDVFLNTGTSPLNIKLLMWNFEHLQDALWVWLRTFLYTYVLVFIYWGWRIDYYGDAGYWFLYFMYLIPLLTWPPTQLAPFQFAGRMIVLCEQVRLVMKSHAFVSETYKSRCRARRRKERREALKNAKQEGSDDLATEGNDPTTVESIPIEDDGDDGGKEAHENDDQRLSSAPVALPDESPRSSESTKEFSRSPTLRSRLSFVTSLDDDHLDATVSTNLKLPDQIACFTYFLFVPTLVYRTSYPMTRRVRWSIAFKCLFEIGACVLYTWTIFCRFLIPVFKKTVQEPGDVNQLISSFINASLPGTVLLLLGFFGILHCWMNLWAELLRFGDRQFYQDWWNAISFSQYYRKWNVVVHDWIYNYMYLPVLERGYSKTVAQAVVFLVSAVIHEYILAFAMNFFFPVLMVMFGGIGTFFIPLTRTFGGNTRRGNVFLWSMLLIGQGMLIVLYSREWYAQQMNVRHLFDEDSWLPYSWQALIKKASK